MTKGRNGYRRVIRELRKLQERQAAIEGKCLPPLPMTATAKRLRKLLDSIGEAGQGLPDFEIRRLYPGSEDQSNGAWLWELFGHDGCPLNIGSRFPITKLLREPSVVYEVDGEGGISLWPGDRNAR